MNKFHEQIGFSYIPRMLSVICSSVTPDSNSKHKNKAQYEHSTELKADRISMAQK